MLDATKCISYLTIEQRGPIPETLREAVGERVFGCDVCQEVCPWNERFATAPVEGPLAPRAENVAPDPVSLLELDAAAFHSRFGDSAVARAGHRGLRRNAAVAAGNRGDARDRDALARAAAEEGDELVRSHARWALGRVLGNR